MRIELGSNALRELAARLSERDLKILSALDWCRYLKTEHVQRLYFTSSPSMQAAKSATMHTLNKLKEYHLVKTLERRVGGVRAVSASFIWCLTEAGYRLLHLSDTEKPIRKRFLELSPDFQNHTLAVSECCVTAVEANRELQSGIAPIIQFEPVCWRPFQHMGKSLSLNPDLYIALRNGDYEDHWFIEMDMGTESMDRIISKCEHYFKYYNTKLEQRRTGTFPIVLWVVTKPDRKRKFIDEMKFRFHNKPKMFVVVCQDELKDVLLNGVTAEQLI